MAVVSATQKAELLKLSKADCTVSFLISKISKTTKCTPDPKTGKKSFDVKPPEWNLQAKMHLKAGEYINEKDIDTTLGSFLLNKLLIEDFVEAVVPGRYWNEVGSKKNFSKLIDAISSGVTEHKLSLNPNVVKFIQAFEFYGLMLCSAVSPSLTPNMMRVDDDLRKMRDELFAKFGDNPSLNDAAHIEDELVKAASKKFKGDPGMTLFDSGSRGSFDDSYKMMSLMVGPVKNNGTGKFDIVKSNFIDGVQKKDLVAIANSAVNSAFSRAVSTAEGGYLTKQFYAVYQSIAMDEHGTDCGSKGYLPMFITDGNYKGLMYQYAVTDKGLVMMTADNKADFVNRTVLLRSPIGCLGKKICNKCMGERFYKLGIENVGLTTGRISNSIMNASLKNVHVAKVKFNKVNVNRLLL